MESMANRAYANIWYRQASDETAALERLARFLGTVPFSASEPGFTYLVIRAIGPEEAPVLERDLRGWPLDAQGIVEIAAPHAHPDSAYEVQAHWDLWVYDAVPGRLVSRPQRLEIQCYGEEYDDGSAWRENGHLQVNIGFEHLFTGHAGLLGFHGQPAAPEHPAEAEFLAAMSHPENLRNYQEKTRENIRKLMEWMSVTEKALPVERYRLWSEGEENFEARLEEILAAR
jgi:hypothetical protein